MLFGRKPAAAALALWAFSLSSSLAQKAGSGDFRPMRTSREYAPDTFTLDDGLSVIAAALDWRAGRMRDCSHLVHAIYERAGFSYPYASSFDLYRGTNDFRRVTDPQPGDLVVWRGHVGIVVNPAQSVFFSYLRHGPGTDSYDARYWRRRGQVRFYRYIKGGPAHDVGSPE
jgi:cell wall-associated NlpC family hydrolase